MKKKTIILLITAISISLIGLISIQLYWIKNAISAKEASFNRGVSEAALSAINKYNKIELADKLFNQRLRNQKFNQIYRLLDSLNRLYYQEFFITEHGGHKQSDENNFSWEDKITLGFNQSINKSKEHYSDTGYVYQAKSSMHYNEGYVQCSRGYGVTNTPFNIFCGRTQIINDFFDDLIYNHFSHKIPDKARETILDSLLNIELQNNGINIDFVFGIYNPMLNSLIGKNANNNYSDKLLEKSYVYSLYPNDVFGNLEYMLLYFPNQKRHVLSQLNLMLGISSIFIFAIIFSFVFILFTIIRQKKLSLMKNDFINNMTHELKTPISIISLACQALNDKDVQKTESLYQSYITMINDENKRLSIMTQKVLQTALIDKGKLKLSTTGLDIHDILHNVIEKSSLQLKHSHGELIAKLNAVNTHIKADKVHLTNVFVNLLDNAIKYTTKNPRITITTKNEEEGVLISIEDNGVGISKSHQKKIFEKLYRISTGNVHDVKGFGLGLSYVKRIVDLHGGNITLKSQPKKGTEFILFLPFDPDKGRKNKLKT